MDSISVAALNDALASSARTRDALAMIGLSPKETKRYSLFRAINSLRGMPHAEDARFERECSNEVEKRIGRPTLGTIYVPPDILSRPLGDAAVRAMSTQPGSKGGFAVGVQTMGFVDIVRARSVALRMGAQLVQFGKSNAVFPRQTGKVTMTWQAGDGTSITAGDQALGSLSTTPKTAIAITDVSEQLLEQGGPAAEQFVSADLAKVVAIDGLDNAVINGTGGAQPIGIKNTAGVTTGQDAASATYAKILEFGKTAGAANAAGLAPGFVTNTAGAVQLQKVQRFSGTDSPIWTGNTFDGELVGFRAMSSEQVASANLIFGSWDEVVIGEWGVLELAVDRGGTRFNTAQVGLRAMWLCDVMLRHPAAFVVSTNLS